ncbi:hypothetical protein SAMN04489867_2462 [Pedococcus dokdonensis]|uniref:Uncharacterized protein n=1 Tax=Pedococcus dokdonensis TaxID=443156 RepID=A0A1H0SQI5_9MICO|nr:hypothetical protein [Pedococcus dokdonensis]SDP43905.1 hypothetical protein SAMN04489867_2462 [Pedococcus dokdonensis]
MTESAQAPAPPTAVPAPGVDPIEKTHPSVRELLTELAALEDATRPVHWSVATAADETTPERLAALAREQEIIEELHRRCPHEPAS